MIDIGSIYNLIFGKVVSLFTLVKFIRTKRENKNKKETKSKSKFICLSYFESRVRV